MPDQSIPPTDYFDDDVTLSVEPPTASRASIRLRAAANGIGSHVDLSATGASRLAALLESAAVAAAAAADFVDEEDPS
jgi:hypothetical protein